MRPGAGQSARPRHVPPDTRATFVSDVPDTLGPCFGPEFSWGESDRQFPPDSGGPRRNSGRMYSWGESDDGPRADLSSGRAVATRVTLL